MENDASQRGRAPVEEIVTQASSYMMFTEVAPDRGSLACVMRSYA